MKSEKVKEMLDSCYMAKRILDMLPKLPEGVLPSYVRYLETIIELEEKNQKVKVSDVSEVLNLPRPGVTRTINAMEEKGYLKKETAKHDGRVTYVTVTKEGKMKAVVSVTFDEIFVVHDIKVIEGEKGLFIAMPSRRSGDGEYRDIAHPINSEMRDKLQKEILEKYEEAVKENDTAE